MRFYTHLLFSILAGILSIAILNLSISPSFFQSAIFFAAFMISSLIPDLDLPESKLGQKIKPLSYLVNLIFGHRNLFHSLFFAAILSGAAYFLIGIFYASAIFFGFLSHIIMDALTPKGVEIFYPFSHYKLRGFIQTGSFMEYGLMAIIIAIILLFAILMLFYI